MLTAGRVSSPLTSRWDRRWSLTSHVPEHHTSWQKVSLFSCLGWLRLVTSQTVSWLLLSLAGRFGFPLQLCCLWDECPLPGTVMTPLLAGSASRRADSVAQPAPTHLSPPAGCKLTPGESPWGNVQGRDMMPAGRASAGSRACITRGSGELGTSQGEPCLGDCFVSWAGGHLRSRNTGEEEEADIPGESTSIRKRSGVQGYNMSQMRLGKVL